MNPRMKASFHKYCSSCAETLPFRVHLDPSLRDKGRERERWKKKSKSSPHSALEYSISWRPCPLADSQLLSPDSSIFIYNTTYINLSWTPIILDLHQLYHLAPLVFNTVFLRVPHLTWYYHNSSSFQSMRGSSPARQCHHSPQNQVPNFESC